MELKKYIGNKNFPGVIEKLVNMIPKSNRYFSLFFGSGGLENSKYLKECLFLCSEKNEECKIYESSTAVIVEKDYKDLIDKNNFTADDFIFADPPYMFSTRKSGRKYYKYEFNTKEHLEFLNRIKNIDAKIMITHPRCILYDKELKKWNKTELTYMTRKGKFKDNIYHNYKRSDIELINYECLGNNFTQRQAIKRQRNRIVEKFKKLDKHILKAIINEITKI